MTFKEAWVDMFWVCWLGVVECCNGICVGMRLEEYRGIAVFANEICVCGIGNGRSVWGALVLNLIEN